MVGEGASADG